MYATDLSYVINIIITLFFIVPFVSVFIAFVCAIILNCRKPNEDEIKESQSLHESTDATQGTKSVKDDGFHE